MKNLIIITVFSFLFTVSFCVHKSFQWIYPSYVQYTKEMNIQTKKVDEYQFCSFQYEGKRHGATECKVQNDNTIHLKTCGNKGEWCSLKIGSYAIKREMNSFCNSISEKYDEVSGMMYLIKLSGKRKIATKIPNCITGV